MEEMPVRVVIEHVKKLGAGEYLWVPAKTSVHSLRVGLLRQAKKSEIGIVTQKAMRGKKFGLKVYRVVEN